VEIRLLGPVEVWGPDGSVDIGHARRRCVLAMLAVDPTIAVSVSEIIEGIWGEVEDRDRARQRVHEYMAHLRKPLKEAFGVNLRNQKGAYVLGVEREKVDLHCFRWLVAEAKRAARTGDDVQAKELFERALGLWRGEPLAGLEEDWACRVRDRLVQERRAALEHWFEVELQLGNHLEVVDPLIDAVRDEPLRERFVGQLMLALYRCQRHSEALDTYQSLRDRLADGDKAIDPGMALQDLYVRMLKLDPQLMWQVAARTDESGNLSHKPSVVDPARIHLLAEVRSLWLSGGLDRSSAGRSRLKLRLTERADAVPDSFRPGSPCAPATTGVPVGKPLLELFNVNYNRSMLILGAAGAGKTTLLLQLTRDLVAQAESDPEETTPVGRIPIVLLLSEWSERADGLAGWIVEEIGRHYRLPAEKARAWLGAGRLTLLLDGVDEVPKAKRRACIKAINEFRRGTGWSENGLVVTARTTDYLDIGVLLDLRGAVSIQPLTRDQIDEYLARSPEAHQLRRIVTTDDVLAEVLASPLMLSVAVQGYKSGQKLPQGGPEDYRRVLNDWYVTSALIRNRARAGRATRSKRWDPEASHRTLVWLARLMENHREATIFYPDWFTAAMLPGSEWRGSLPRPKSSWLLSRWGGWRQATVALTYGLTAGVVVGALYGLQAWHSRRLVASSPDSALITNPAYALPVAFVVCLSVVATYLFWRTGPRGIRVAVYTSVFFAAGGLHKGVFVARHEGSGRGLVAGLSGGLVYGATSAASTCLALALIFWLVKTNSQRPGSRWYWSWSRMCRGLDAAMSIAIAVGISHALAHITVGEAGLVYNALSGLGYGLIMGLGGGLMVGIAFGLVDVQTDRPAPVWFWSWRRLALAALATTAYGLVNWLLLVRAVGALMGPDKGPIFGLIIGLTLCLTFGLGYSMVPDHDLPLAPARALTASLRAAAGPTLIASALTLLAAFLARRSVVDYVEFIMFGPAVLAGLLTFWFTGGGVWLGHHVARWAAWSAGLLPWDLLDFLAHCEERALLRRDGGGYQFFHLTLRDHFARHDPGQPPGYPI
jgi:DNA-binding SARP family transcriptional activator/GTPase SAR1 family protein